MDKTLVIDADDVVLRRLDRLTGDRQPCSVAELAHDMPISRPA